jgi:hypothetical protein
MKTAADIYAMTRDEIAKAREARISELVDENRMLLAALQAMDEITPRLQLTDEEAAALALLDAAIAKATGAP